MKVHFSIVILFLSSSVLFSQWNESILPNLKGDELFNRLSTDYSPTNLYSYNVSRDSLFARVYAENDSLSCMYSGWTLYLDPSLDPTQAVFQDGGNEGINTEHVYPQSQGATQGTPAHADMHHLFPTRVPVNNARGSDPFGEILDSQTLTWYKDNLTLTTMPQNNIDQYAEDNSTHFEPREMVKGNAARAIFYVYTIYHDQVSNVNDDFFDSMKSDLCNWHIQDPVDSLEWVRNQKIKNLQGNANPYVLDFSLPCRMFCTDEPSCTVSTEAIEVDSRVKAYFIDDHSIKLLNYHKYDAYRLSDINGVMLQQGSIKTNGIIDNISRHNQLFVLTIYSSTQRGLTHSVLFSK